jgi:hypothetical protein
MKSIQLLIKQLADKGIYRPTYRFEHAIYLLPDGTMIDGDYCDGIRGADHRAIFGAVNYGSYYETNNTNEFWKRLHRDYRLVRLVPETKTALLKGRQQLTPIQRHLILRNGYTIERY